MDKKLQQKIEEFGNLSDQIKKLEAELKNLQKIAKPLDDELTKYLIEVSNTKDFILKTENYIVKINTPYNVNKGTSKKYKDAFELALTKVNEATRNVLNDAISATAGDTVTKLKYSIDNTNPDKVNESFLSDLWGKAKRLYNRLISRIKGYNRTLAKAVTVLANLAKQSTNENKSNLNLVKEDDQEMVNKFVTNLVKKDLESLYKKFKKTIDQLDINFSAVNTHKLFVRTVNNVTSNIK